MICPPCAAAADATPQAHDPQVCRDRALQPHGCTCQHGDDRD